MSRRYFASPFIVWIAAGTVIPLIMIAYYGFTDRSGAFTIENVVSIMGAEHAQALWLALLLALISTAICFVLAFPLALILKDSRLGTKGFMIFIFVLPMWMNFLIRTYAWMTILQDTGIFNNFLTLLHLPNIHIIGTEAAVVIGMVYDYIPYMILPLYSIMAKMDERLIEAARDLGCSSFGVLRRVIWPLSLPGVISGITMVLIPSVSTFYISQKLGDGKIMLIGDVIEGQYVANNLHFAAAISFVLMVLLLVCMAVMRKLAGRRVEGGL